MSTHASLEPSSQRFAKQLLPVLLITGVFLANFLARIIVGPMLPTLERELDLTHSAAGTLIFIVSIGYGLALLASTFVSSRITHRSTIILSAVSVGLALSSILAAEGAMGLGFGLFALGIAAGLYLPSGLATITTMIVSRDWGKALAVHELAPNLSFVVAPVLAEALLERISWKGTLAVLGVASLILGSLFALFGKGGRFTGQALRFQTMKELLRNPSIWIMMLFFSMGIGASLAVYNMIPLFLVSEHAMARETANNLLALSRISGIGAAFFAGWMMDRVGAKRFLGGCFICSGTLTVLLGLAHGFPLIVLVFLHPMVAVTFFPAAFASLSRLTAPNNRGAAVALVVPMAFTAGGGWVSTGIGFAGDLGSFGYGFVVFGVMILASVLLLPLLRFHTLPDDV